MEEFGPADFIPTLGTARGNVDFVQGLFTESLAARGSENVFIIDDAFARVTGDAYSRLQALARLRANELIAIEITAPLNAWLFNGILETCELGESIRGLVADRVIDHPAGGKRRYVVYAIDDELGKSPTAVVKLQELPK